MRYIKSFKYLEKTEMQCIETSAENHLYVTNDNIITHNSPATVYVQALGAWTHKKASEILLEPIMNILSSSPYFQQMRTRAELIDKEVPPEELEHHMMWTTATKTAQPLDCKVYLADGSTKNMGDVEIGDKLKSPTGGTSTVIAIPYEGEDVCYEIELEDGRKTKCNAEHLWKAAYKKDGQGEWIYEIMPLQFILDHPELEFDIYDVA